MEEANKKIFNEELKKIKRGDSYPSAFEFIKKCRANNFIGTGEFLSQFTIKKLAMGYIVDGNKIEDLRFKLNSELLIFKKKVYFWKGEFKYADMRFMDDTYVFDQLEDGVICFDIRRLPIISLIKMGKQYVILFDDYVKDSDNENTHFFIIFIISSKEAFLNITDTIKNTLFSIKQIQLENVKSETLYNLIIRVFKKTYEQKNDMGCNDKGYYDDCNFLSLGKSIEKYEDDHSDVSVK